MKLFKSTGKALKWFAVSWATVMTMFILANIARDWVYMRVTENA